MSQDKEPAIRNVPSELWGHIFLVLRDNDTSRPTFKRAANLKPLLLTCRHLYNIGLPYAYESIRLYGNNKERCMDLMDVLERDERKRTSVRELFLSVWYPHRRSHSYWDEPTHEERVAMEETAEMFATLEWVVTNLNQLRAVYANQVTRVSGKAWRHILNLPTLRDLHLEMSILPKHTEMGYGRGYFPAQLRVLEIMFCDFPSPLSSSHPPWRMDTIQHLTLSGPSLYSYHKLRLLHPYMAPRSVKVLRLSTVHRDPMLQALHNLLQDCPDIEELAFEDSLLHGRTLPGLERLKRFKGRLETATSFCKGRPLERMALGPLETIPKAEDLREAICCPSAPLLRIHLWGTAWDTGIITTIANSCPLLKELEVMSTQEKPMDLSSLVLLLKPLIHLTRLRLEGRKIHGQLRLERAFLQQLNSEQSCLSLQEVQLSEDRYWEKKTPDHPWIINKLSTPN